MGGNDIEDKSKFARVLPMRWSCIYQGGHPDFFMEGVPVEVYIKMYSVGLRYLEGELIFEGEGIINGKIPLLSINISNLRIIKPNKPKIIKKWFGLRKKKIMEYTLIVPFSKDYKNYEVKFVSENLGSLNSLLLKIKDEYQRIYNSYLKNYEIQKGKLLNDLESAMNDIESMTTQIRLLGCDGLNLEKISKISDILASSKQTFEKLYSESLLESFKDKISEFYLRLSTDRKNVLEKIQTVERNYAAIQAKFDECSEKLEKDVISKIEEIEDAVNKLKVISESGNMKDLLESIKEIEKIEEKVESLRNVDYGLIQNIINREKYRLDNIINQLNDLKTKIQQKLPQEIDRKITEIKENFQLLEEKVETYDFSFNNSEKLLAVKKEIRELNKEVEELKENLEDYLHNEIIMNLHSKLLNEVNELKRRLAEKIYQKLIKELESDFNSINENLKILGVRG